MSEPLGCCRHLPGNVQCPYEPLYLVAWRHSAPRAAGTPARVLKRPVCVFHLEAAIRGALEDSMRGDHVEVTLDV